MPHQYNATIILVYSFRGVAKNQIFQTNNDASILQLVAVHTTMLDGIQYHNR